MCSSCSASFWFFSEEIAPYVAVDSVCLWEEGSLRYFYAAILSLRQNMTFSQFLSWSLGSHDQHCLFVISFNIEKQTLPWILMIYTFFFQSQNQADRKFYLTSNIQRQVEWCLSVEHFCIIHALEYVPTKVPWIFVNYMLIHMC